MSLVLGSSLSLILLCSVAWGCSLPFCTGPASLPLLALPGTLGAGDREGEGAEESSECGKTARTPAHDRVKPFGTIFVTWPDDSSDLELCFSQLFNLSVGWYIVWEMMNRNLPTTM